MLLTKTVIIKWNVNNKEWYVNKGYLFTRYNDEFEVEVKHLSHGSQTPVTVQCDECGEISHKVLWQNYNRYKKENGEYFCHNCSDKLFGKEKQIQSRLRKSKSFEQWCIDNDRIDILNRWDYKSNNCNPNEISYGSKRKYWLKCPKGLHQSELKCINSFTNGQDSSMKCKKCNSFAQYCIDNICKDFLEKCWDYKLNKKDPWALDHGSNKKVYIKCQTKNYHDSYPVSCNDFSTGKSSCPYCNSHGKIHPLDSLGSLHPQVLKLWSDKNKETSFQYSPNSHSEVFWKCENGKHNDYLRSINASQAYDFRCPECTRERDESRLQEKVRLYLHQLGFQLNHEYNCSIIAKNPKVKDNRGLMPYDNEVIGLKLIIEVHGLQHYEITYYAKLRARFNNTTPEYELHQQKLRDRYKRMYAKIKEGYFYLVIPYWTEKDESYKELISSKINDILSNQCITI